MPILFIFVNPVNHVNIRVFKKHLHHYSYLTLEYEDVRILNEEYTKIFNSKFFEFLSPEDPKDPPPKIDQTSKTKKLFRKLSRHLHPDKVEGKDDAFKKASECYKEGNLMGLIEVAVDQDIPAEEFHEAEPEIIYSIQLLEYKIALIKHGLPWRWCTGDNSEKTRIKQMFNR